jgi:alcohol dehydrogenase
MSRTLASRIPGTRSSTGLVDTYSTPKLLDMLIAGHLDTSHMVAHRFAPADIMEAYDVFSRPAQTGALKIVLSRRMRAVP